jgi:hypothetical protein
MTTNVDLKVLPTLNIYGGLISVASNTTLTVTAYQVRDSSNSVDLEMSSSATLNTAVVGLNGIDAGTLDASTMYAIYAIGASSKLYASGVTATLASNTAPTLPYGYDAYYLLGYALTDGSTHFLPCKHVGQKSERAQYWDVPISVKSSGTDNSFTAIDMSGAMPAIANSTAILTAEFTAATADDSFAFRPKGSSSTNGTNIFYGIVASKKSSQWFEIPVGIASAKAQIDYKVSAGSLTDLSLNGFKYTI